jgi:hypothetical protein
MPRKISKEKLDDLEDEKKGSNVVLLADEDFGNVQVRKRDIVDYTIHRYIPLYMKLLFRW